MPQSSRTGRGTIILLYLLPGEWKILNGNYLLLVKGTHDECQKKKALYLPSGHWQSDCSNLHFRFSTLADILKLSVKFLPRFSVWSVISFAYLLALISPPFFSSSFNPFSILIYVSGVSDSVCVPAKFLWVSLMFSLSFLIDFKFKMQQFLDALFFSEIDLWLVIFLSDLETF